MHIIPIKIVSILQNKLAKIKKLYNKMIVNHNNPFPAEEQVILTVSGCVYRINQKEYNAKERHLTFFLYYLVTLMLLANAYNVYLLVPSQLRLVVVYAVVVHLPIGVFLLRQRNHMLVVLVNYFILVLNLVIVAVIPTDKIFIAAAVFVGVAFFVNLGMLDEKKFVAYLILILVQAILVQLKVSGRIVEDWKLVLMPITATQICLVFAIVIFLTLAVLEGCNGEIVNCPLWRYNIGIKIMMTSAHAIQLSLPISLVYSESYLLPILLVIAIETHHLILILLVVFKKQCFICCFTIPTKEASLFQNGEQVSAMEKTIQRVSSHWFALEEKSTVNPNPNPTSSELIAKKEECVVCLTDPACIVWSPCGHLSTCQKCASYLITTGKTGCLLCKKPAKKILKVIIQNPIADTEYVVQNEFSISRRRI